MVKEQVFFPFCASQPCQVGQMLGTMCTRQGSKIPVQQISWKLSYKGNCAVEADRPVCCLKWCYV